MEIDQGSAINLMIPQLFSKLHDKSANMAVVIFEQAKEFGLDVQTDDTANGI